MIECMVNDFERGTTDRESKKPIYDDMDALEFIRKETGMNPFDIRKVMNADLRYQRSVGIINWPDLEQLIKGCDEAVEEKYSHKSILSRIFKR